MNFTHLTRKHLGSNRHQLTRRRRSARVSKMKLALAALLLLLCIAPLQGCTAVGGIGSGGCPRSCFSTCVSQIGLIQMLCQFVGKTFGKTYCTSLLKTKHTNYANINSLFFSKQQTLPRRQPAPTPMSLLASSCR